MAASMDSGIYNTPLSPTVMALRSPAADRNKDFILDVLTDLLPPTKPLMALEVASGTGQHVVHFASNLPHITWQPTECNQQSLQSVRGYIKATETKTVQQPAWLDTTQPPEQWANASISPQSCDLVLSINLVHISAWPVTEGLFRGCRYYLKPGGILITYGPYKVHGDITPESNQQFDRMLKQQNSEWGLRDVDDLERLATDNDMHYEKMENDRYYNERYIDYIVPL